MAHSVVPFWKKRKWLTGGNGISKPFVDNRFAVYTFLTKEKCGSVSDNYNLGTIKYDTRAVLS